MNWVGLWVFLIVLCITYIFTVSTTPLNDGQKDVCSSKCISTILQFVCNGCIPDSVQNETEIFLVKISPRDLQPRRFCEVSWSSVTRLSISTADNVNFALENGAFDCLERLKYFRLSSQYLLSIDVLAFRGLSNLEDFGLSDSGGYFFADLTPLLSRTENFPSLLRFTITSDNYVVNLNIDYKFVIGLTLRPIRYIDLSRNSFRCQVSTSGTLCDHLDTIIIRNALINYDDCYSHPICNSLRVFDLSGTLDFFKRLTCLHTTKSYGSLLRFFRGAPIMILNEVIPQNLTTVQNCSLRLLYNTLVEEFHFSKNQLSSFEFKLINDRFKFLNLSYNKIEKIHPDAIKFLPSLTKIDLSHNQLSKANALRDLFKHSKQLKEIDLSANDLETLPYDTFVFNIRLELLNLSFNSLSRIHFHFWNLSNLRIIDLSWNAIRSFDALSCRVLDDWYKFHLLSNSSVRMSLAGNSFSCSCSSLEFLNWFLASTIFAPSIPLYHCYLDGQKIPMTRALTAAHENCDKIRRQRLLKMLGSTLLPFFLLVTSAFAVIVFRHQRRKRQAKLYDNKIRLLREHDEKFQFAVFLSYSSDEDDFVIRNIQQPLQEELRNITHIDKDLVCYADRHFVPGRTIISEIMRCLEECPVLVAVVSEKFCASQYCRYEIQTAHTEGMPIILIFKEHVSEDKMDPVTRKIFRHFTRVKCVFKENGVDLEPGWEQLCKSIIELIKE